MTMKKNALPAQALLVREGLCSDLEEAKRWIMAGKVIANDQRVEKPGELVPHDAELRIKGKRRYVGKGGLKLEGALSDFGITADGKTVLDVGASTGGFTDCLLQHGAHRVYAVDAGYGTLAGRLRNDKRVVNLERTNISELDPAALDPLPSLATVDVSYLSLRKAVPITARRLTPGGQMLCLVKPLFEIPDSAARRRGKIPDPAAYRGILNALAAFVRDSGLSLFGITHSHVRGNRGTIEFWMWISTDPTATLNSPLDVSRTVETAMALPR